MPKEVIAPVTPFKSVAEQLDAAVAVTNSKRDTLAKASEARDKASAEFEDSKKAVVDLHQELMKQLADIVPQQGQSFNP